MCTKGIHSQVSMDTLDLYPQLTLDGYSINTSVDTPATLHWHLGQQLVESRLIFNRCIWVGQHSANYPSTVDQVSIECLPSIIRDVYWDVDWNHRSTLEHGYFSYTWSRVFWWWFFSVTNQIFTSNFATSWPQGLCCQLTY